MAASTLECRAKLRTAVALQDEYNIVFYTARVEFYVGMEKQFLANADKYARKLAEKEAAEAAADEGVVLVQPETVARTIEILDEEIEDLREEAEQAANRDTSEWRARGGIDHAQRSQRLLVSCVEHGNLGTAQGMIGMVEEMMA